MARDLRIETVCPECKKPSTVMVDRKDFEAFQLGKFVQDAFPYLNADERELFLTGIDKVCWDKMFKGRDDE